MSNHNPSPFNVRDGDSDPSNKAMVRQANALVTVPYDTIIVNYTDGTKEVISTVVYKTGGASGTTVATITYTSASTSDTYVRS